MGSLMKNTAGKGKPAAFSTDPACVSPATFKLMAPEWPESPSGECVRVIGRPLKTRQNALKRTRFVSDNARNLALRGVYEPLPNSSSLAIPWREGDDLILKQVELSYRGFGSVDSG